MKELSLEEIKEILPYGDSMLLVDSAIVFNDRKITGIKKITGQEFFMRDHFGIMPGFLISEAMAQTGAVLILGLPENQGKIAQVISSDGLRFLRSVQGGDELRIEVEITFYHKGRGGKATGKAYVNNYLVAEIKNLSFVLSIPLKKEEISPVLERKFQLNPA